MVGTYEYSDFPMGEATWGVKPGQHIPGNVLHDYLTAYAKKFGVLERIRFNTKVDSVERGEKGGWLLQTNTENTIFAKKLVVATGLTSQAFMPTFEGEDSFEAPLFHSKDFLQHKETIQTAKKVTILGGTKSAWDAVYAYASEDVEVDWIIRGKFMAPENGTKCFQLVPACPTLVVPTFSVNSSNYPRYPEQLHSIVQDYLG